MAAPTRPAIPRRATLSGAKTLDNPTEIRSWPFVKGVDVKVPAQGAAVVAFGDSITDGAFAALNQNARWPDELARRLLANPKTAEHRRAE